jgi:hypothetical protein
MMALALVVPGVEGQAFELPRYPATHPEQRAHKAQQQRNRRREIEQPSSHSRHPTARQMLSLPPMSHRPRLLATFFVLLGIASPTLVRGWGGTGHQIVCLIAEEHLTSAAKTGIHELLGEGNISDAEVASWADEVRRQRRETAPWHYVNIPVEAAAFDRARDGRDGNNVIDAVEQQARIVADKSKPKEQRADALKFLVHFVGDLHQPLHCADRAGDKGGNARLVVYPGQKRAVSLHAIWHTWLLKDAMKRARATEYARALDKRVTPKQRAEWSKGTPQDWANASHRIAVGKAYADVPKDGAPPTIDPKYIADGKTAVEEQLKRAGARLAAVLNQIFIAK